jgi:hypothetical protein
MSIIQPTPQQANIAELLEMIREIGGTAEAFTVLFTRFKREKGR